ncbi:MAG TPA: ABC transporter permease subunit/CPBP intramembrane protease [Tepidisphaeraceae bacterium]|nr:ABC transporter permease subunit/CPBP intramembrane protease [Tepidisphaeraceae bacterium]
MRLRIIKIVFLKELREMLRDRRSLTIMFGIPLVLYPLLTVVIASVGMSKKKEFAEKPARVAVVNERAAPQLMERLVRPDSGLRVIATDRPAEDLAAGKIDAVLVVPPDAERAALELKEPQFETRLDRSRTSAVFAESKVNKALTAYEQWVIEQRLRERGQPAEVVRPLKRTVSDIATADQRFGKVLSMTLPVLLLMTGMLGALFPALNATTTERELGTLETLLVTPAGRIELLVAKGTLVLLSGLLTAFLNMFSMALVIWRSFSLIEASMGNMTISLSALSLTYLAAVPTLITFSTMVLIVGLLARNFREANSLATPLMMIPLASMVVGIAEPEMSPGLLVTPVANTTIIIREVLTGRVSPGPFVLAFISSCAYAGLLLSVAARVFTNEQLVNPSWEPVSLKGLTPGRGRGGRRNRPARLPAVDEALALFAVALLLSFYVAPSLQRFGLVPMIVVQQVALLAAPALLWAWLGGWRWRDTFSWRRPAAMALVAAVLLGVGLAPWMQFIGTLQAKIWPPGEAQARLAQFLLRPLEQHPLFLPLLIGVLAGACEETLFRGPIQRGLLRRLPKWPAIVAASVLFAAAHLDLYGLPIRTFLGVLLGWMVVRTGSVFPAMLMHATYDIVQLLHVSREINKVGATKVLEMATTSQGSGLSAWMLVGAALLIAVAMVLLFGSPKRAETDAGPLPQMPPI